MDIATFYFGLFWGIFPFTAAKVMQQTRKILARSRTLPHHAYLYMIWVELVVNVVFNLTSFLYLIGVIKGSVGFFIGITVVWILQTQLLTQIIANRVSILVFNQRKARWMKLGLVVLVLAVNISVASFWNPGQWLDASPRAVQLMKTIERAEKVFFLILDLGLSLIFLYVVRFRLIALGLNKYWRLFYFNIAAICLSTIMDALFVGMLSLPSPYLYVQFAPVAYIVKLHVELTMAALIAKIVKSGSNNTDLRYSLQAGSAKCHTNFSTFAHESSHNGGSSGVDTSTEQIEMGAGSAAGSDTSLVTQPPDNGIVKTVTTVVVAKADKEDVKANLQAQRQGQPWAKWH